MVIYNAQRVPANAKIFELKDNARNILTAERTMLNFIQMLSAIATTANKLVKLISHCIGLFDIYLIKENHIRSAGCIAKAVANAKKSDSSKVVEVEVTNLDELNQAIATRVGIPNA